MIHLTVSMPLPKRFTLVDVAVRAGHMHRAIFDATGCVPVIQIVDGTVTTEFTVDSDDPREVVSSLSTILGQTHSPVIHARYGSALVT